MAISETYTQKFNRLYDSVSKRLNKPVEKKCICGNALPEKGAKPGKQAIYCSQTCRPSYKEPKIKDYNCAYCKNPFQATSRGRHSGKNTFCSSPCSNKFYQEQAKNSSTVEEAMQNAKPARQIQFDKEAVDLFPSMFSHPNEFNDAKERTRKFFINVLAARAAKSFQEFRQNGGGLTQRKYDRIRSEFFTSDGNLVAQRVLTNFRTGQWLTNQKSSA